MVQATVSLTRLNNFLNAEEIDTKAIGVDTNNKDHSIDAVNASFTWDQDTPIPTLSNITLELKKNSCVAIVGQVGSGKSSLLSAFIGDMNKVHGDVNVSGSIAYVPQVAWIQNAPLKYNVIFGQKLNQQVSVFFGKKIELFENILGLKNCHAFGFLKF